MSSFAGYCDWCGKPVMHKTLFGTLHICITDEEKQSVAAYRRQVALNQYNSAQSNLLKQFNAKFTREKE